VEILDDEEPHLVAPESAPVAADAVERSKSDNYTDGLDELIAEQKLNGEIVW
jgi:hypothetical protein